MKNTKGFARIMVITIIAIIAAGLAGGAWYYNKQHAGICDTLNKKTEHSPCTNVQFTESQKATIAQSYAPCEVAFASPSTGTIFSVDAGCTPGSTGYLTDQGYNFFNAKSEKITNCNAFFVETGDTSLCDWLNNLDLKILKSSTNANTNVSGETICELETIYKATAVNPTPCTCPDGYEFETVSMGWGPCPTEGMSDCPAPDLRCVKSE